MSKHLGRNPFEKKKIHAAPTPERPSEKEKLPRLVHWAFIQVPAQSAVFALKAALRVKDLLEGK